jgi:hypothetical protein
MSVCVFPPTVALPQNLTCADLPSSPSIDFAAAKSEREQAQIYLDITGQHGDGSVVSLDFSDAPFGADAWQYYQVGYVMTNETSRYSPSGGGWRPDPLLPVDTTLRGVQLEVGVGQPLWVRLDVPSNATAGNYRRGNQNRRALHQQQHRAKKEVASSYVYSPTILSPNK